MLAFASNIQDEGSDPGDDDHDSDEGEGSDKVSKDSEVESDDDDFGHYDRRKRRDKRGRKETGGKSAVQAAAVGARSHQQREKGRGVLVKLHITKNYKSDTNLPMIPIQLLMIASCQESCIHLRLKRDD